MARKEVPERHVVFHNTIVNHRDPPAVGKVGVCVCIGRFPVRGPACVANAANAVQFCTVLRAFFEFRKAALGLDHVDAFVRRHRKACGVIAAVFELGQSIEQDRRRLPRSGVTYDSTHVFTSHDTS